MDNQHRLIKGYRDLSAEEIQFMNDIKLAAEGIKRLCNVIKQNAGVDPRWHAIAVTDLQKGFMALVRSVAKPESF